MICCTNILDCIHVNHTVSELDIVKYNAKIAIRSCTSHKFIHAICISLNKIS